MSDRPLNRDVEGLREPGYDRPLLNEQATQLVLMGAQQQMPDRELARLAGVPTREWSAWKRRARIQEALFETDGVPLGRYGQLFRAIEEATAQGSLLLGQVVFNAALGDPDKGRPGDAKMALEILSRRRPAEWGQVNRFRIDEDEREEMADLLALAAAGRSLDQEERERAAIPAASTVASSSVPAGTSAQDSEPAVSPELAALLDELNEP